MGLEQYSAMERAFAERVERHLTVEQAVRLANRVVDDVVRPLARQRGAGEGRGCGLVEALATLRRTGDERDVAGLLFHARKAVVDYCYARPGHADTIMDWAAGMWAEEAAP